MHINQLEEHLKTRSYIAGYSLTESDRAELQTLGFVPSKETYPNTYRWAIHIIALTGHLTTTAQPVAEKAPSTITSASTSKPANDDFDDMFGDDDDEVDENGENATERAATKARQERMALAVKLKEEKEAKEGTVKKEKAKAVEKSLCVLEVKPWEEETDLVACWNKIIEYKQEGLSWGQTYKLEPVAYGIKKLVLTCTIVDSLVLMDDVTDNIEAMEDYVQSVEVVSMNKIS